jgi:hypothetical protein
LYPDSAVLLRILQCGNQQIRIEAGAAAAFVDGSRAVMLVEAATPADLGEAMRAVSVPGSDSGTPSCGRPPAAPAYAFSSAKIFRTAK